MLEAATESCGRVLTANEIPDAIETSLSRIAEALLRHHLGISGQSPALLAGCQNETFTACPEMTPRMLVIAFAFRTTRSEEPRVGLSLAVSVSLESPVEGANEP